VTDATSAEIGRARRDWKTEHQATYLASRGAQGHIVDLSDIGGHALTPTLLLRYVGRKSGRTLITPLIYGAIGGEVVIVASKGGADHHPAWYLDLRDGKELGFQIATQAFRASWREPEGAARARVWDFMVGVFPPYEKYQASTGRRIPLVMMSPVAPVDVFET
jgi:deazaflavin-dependent oxidoreductase (nitroreductase family)